MGWNGFRFEVIIDLMFFESSHGSCCVLLVVELALQGLEETYDHNLAFSYVCVFELCRGGYQVLLILETGVCYCFIDLLQFLLGLMGETVICYCGLKLMELTWDSMVVELVEGFLDILLNTFFVG